MQHTVSLIILFLWPLLAGFAIYRPTPVARSLASESTLPTTTISPVREEWMGIYQQDEKVGYLQRRLTATTAGYQWEEQWWLNLHILDSVYTIHTELRAHTDQTCALLDFSLWSVSTETVLYVSAEVVKQGTFQRELRGQVISEGTTTPFVVPLQTALHLPTLWQVTEQSPLRQGQERQFNIFNPLSLDTDTVRLTTSGQETLTLNGQTVLATKVIAHFPGGTLHAWLDQNGSTLKEETAPGLVLLRENPENAANNAWQDNAAVVPVINTNLPALSDE